MLTNNVDPTGVISMQDAPFTFVGNRGVLDRDGEVRKTHDGKKPWIYCAVSALRDPSGFMNGMSQTDLFFLDEATALAAGHRPCHLCLGKRQGEFLKAWRKAVKTETNPIGKVDEVLNEERLTQEKTKRTEWLKAESLPTGTLIRIDGAPFLVASDAVPNKVDPRSVIYPWSLEGYGRPIARPTGLVEVLTPTSTVKVLASGGFDISIKHLVMRWD